MRKLAGILGTALFFALVIGMGTDWGKRQFAAIVYRIAGAPQQPAARYDFSKLKRLRAPPATLPPLQGSSRPLVPGTIPGGTFRTVVAFDWSPRGGYRVSPARQVISNSRIFNKLVDDLNGLFVLPRDVLVRLERCGKLDIHYDPATSSILICDEFVEQQNRLFANVPPQQLQTSILFAVTFAFLHEVGHALVHQFAIAATGRPEDVADQLAVFLVVGTDLGDDIAFAGAQYFARSSLQRPVAAASLADEHSLDEQRAYNILCWMYGADPQKHTEVIRSGALPPERAARCPHEFASFAVALREKLLSHLRT